MYFSAPPQGVKFQCTPRVRLQIRMVPVHRQNWTLRLLFSKYIFNIFFSFTKTDFIFSFRKRKGEKKSNQKIRLQLRKKKRNLNLAHRWKFLAEKERNRKDRDVVEACNARSKSAESKPAWTMHVRTKEERKTRERERINRQSKFKRGASRECVCAME